MAATATQQQVGKIVQIIGPVVDVEFEAGHLPAIYNALSIKSEGTAAGSIDIVVEFGTSSSNLSQPRSSSAVRS